MSAPTWAKVAGLGALALAGLGIAAVVVNGDDEEGDGGTIPPDDIEGDDDDEDDDDSIPVETVPEIFEK